MAQIQWYPGHMHKASKEMRQALSSVDLFIELLDSRIPYSSQNPMLEEIRGEKPLIRVMTRGDLSDPARTDDWMKRLETDTASPVILHHQGRRQTVDQLIARCRERLTDSKRNVVAMVVGIPNVGKSTLINLISGRSIAKTGNEPAITKMQQRIQLDQNVSLMDTPGVLWPNVQNPLSGFRLAATGAIRETAVDQVEVSRFLGGYLLENYPTALTNRYRYESPNPDAESLLHRIGETRGGLRKGGKVDMDRAARVLLNDFRDGTLGRITLETPKMMDAELIETAAVQQERDQRKRERKAAWKAGA